jgi:hypothetical protein
MPYRAFDFFVIDELFSLGHAFEEFPKRAVGLLGPGPEALVHGLAIGISEQRGIACVQQDGKAHVLRMVRYNQKVQRAEQLDARATASRKLFSACEPECRVRAQCVADETGVWRVGGVMVRVAPKHTVREMHIHVGRVVRLVIGGLVRLDREFLRLCARCHQSQGAGETN